MHMVVWFNSCVCIWVYLNVCVLQYVRMYLYHIQYRRFIRRTQVVQS